MKNSLNCGTFMRAMIKCSSGCVLALNLHLNLETALTSANSAAPMFKRNLYYNKSVTNEGFNVIAALTGIEGIPLISSYRLIALTK